MVYSVSICMDHYRHYGKCSVYSASICMDLQLVSASPWLGLLASKVKPRGSRGLLDVQRSEGNRN